MKKFLFNNSKREMQKMLLNIGSTIDYKLIPKKSVYRFNY